MISPGRMPALSAAEPATTDPTTGCTLRQVQRFDKGFARGTITYAKLPSLDAPGGYQLVGHVSYGIDGDGEADSLISARASDNSRVDPDQFAPQIDQWPPGISRIDRCIRLNEIICRGGSAYVVIYAAVSYPNPACCADDTRGNRIAERCFYRRSESHDPLSDLDMVGVSHADIR